MVRTASSVLAALLLALTASWAAEGRPSSSGDPVEVIFAGREIDLPKPFECGARTRAAGRYALKATWDSKAAKSMLTVLKGEDELCTVPGETLAGSDLPATKVRVLVKLNTADRVLEVDMIMPSGGRDRIPNQVFRLPLSSKS